MNIVHFVLFASICLSLLGLVNLSSPFLFVLAETHLKDSNGELKRVILYARDAVIEVSPSNQLKPGGVSYEAMTFNGTVPGPWISIDQGDILDITLVNQADTVHSLDLHAGYGPSQAISGSIEPGQNKTLRLKANYPGVFMYHCDGDNLNGIWEHVASGMYGGIIVHPKNEVVAKEFRIIFSEIFNSADNGLFKGTGGKIGSFDFNKFVENKPDLILTNGMAYKYMPFFGDKNKIQLNTNAQIFKVKPGELTRWYVVNGGARGIVAFNFVGGFINEKPDTSISHSNNSKNFSQPKVYEISVPPGAGTIAEVTFPEEGTYFGNDHDLVRLLNGAGFVVLATRNSTTDDHPNGS